VHPTTRTDPSGKSRAPLTLIARNDGRTRAELADELERLRAQLRAGEANHQRSAEELAHTRHEIGLVREQLRNATLDDQDD